jgi:tRNA modification GTPase
MAGPKSYTGEDVVEVYCHGGMAVMQSALDMILALGPRMALRGEFTKRAFLNGKLDLAQAEAVLDLVKAPTGVSAGLAVSQLEGRLSQVISQLRNGLLDVLAGLEARIDFPDDLPELDAADVEEKIKGAVAEVDKLICSAGAGRVYRDGLATVILGKPNVGKSSLLNALLGEERAIVTELPGTTRDSIEESISIFGLPLKVIDTAGIRHPKDQVEVFGIARTEKELSVADFVLVVLDASKGIDDLDRMVIGRAAQRNCVLVLNKIDLGCRLDVSELACLGIGPPGYKISALHGQGIDELKRGIYSQALALFGQPERNALVINARHKECLLRAREALIRAAESGRVPELAVLATLDLKAAVIALGEVTGELVSEEIINRIFDSFCVGK